MENEIKLYEKGLEEYPKSGIILGNIVMIFWIALGTTACSYLYPPIAWLYLAFAIAMVFIVLRKLVCTNCYYFDKWCCMGWGKISCLFFDEGNLGDFHKSIGMKLAPVTYGLLTIIPVVMIIISLILEFTMLKLAVLVLLLSVSVYSGAISRKKTCSKCKMKLVCPGSAAK
ncbi:MAG: hypothetical protein U9Q92_04110 [archaeon]|nr:hypothetical protein [archaeon]